jgi:thioredoxin reductase (NADPH)
MPMRAMPGSRIDSVEISFDVVVLVDVRVRQPVTHRGAGARCGCESRYLIERIEVDPRIEVRPGSRIRGLDGDGALSEVDVTAGDDDVVMSTTASFSLIGADPHSDWLIGSAAFDERGFLLADRSLTEEHLASQCDALDRRPLPFETNVPGLCAA